MLKRIIYTLLIISACSSACGQAVKYKDLVFKNSTVTKNISYRPGEAKNKHWLMDFYEPQADTTLRRPLIIWIHGGGFKFGTKKSAGTPIWSRSFARRGYVCAAVNYRLSKGRPLAKFPDLVAGCYEAMQDIEQAVAFFKKHEAQYRIDTNRIALAGNSAGGMIALQEVYGSFYELAHFISTPVADTVSHAHNPSGIAAVVNFWGALFDTAWLQNARVPIVSVHGTKDGIVPYDHKAAPLYGSFAIHRRADTLGIPNSLKLYAGYGHELQKYFNPLWAGGKTKKRWLNAGQFAADFLYSVLQ